jgi:hypothetical protein
MKKLILLSVFFVTVSVLCFGETPASLKKVITSDMIIQPDPENPFQGTWFFESSRNNFWVAVIEGMTGTVYLYTSRQWKRQSVFIIEKKDDVYVIPSPLGGDSRLILTNNNNLLTIFNMTYERYVN